MKLLLTSIALACVFAAQGQITGFVCSELTQYTNTNPNDSIYYYPQNELGSLLATGSSGVAPYTFSWNYFNLTAGAWSPYFSEVAASSSLIENLQPGAYNVVITDANGTTVGCDNAWIVQYLIGEGGGGGLTVDLFPIEPSCTQIVLQGVIDINPPWGTGGFTTGYSNLPPNPMFVDASTAINVCFTGTHTWVSDIAFYLVGPASCGSPSVVLSPNPGAIGQGSVCNSGNNISNLCFSTESTNNLNVCTATAPLTGTYGTYGLSNTSPNWAAFYGCETTNAGWAVQIYDCIGGDVGALTDATLTFTGLSGCGGMQTITYSTPPGFSSTISDNSCSASSASIFSVPPITVIQPIECDLFAEISSEPYTFMADSLDEITSFPYNFNMTITLPLDENQQPIPLQNFDFTLSVLPSCSGGTPNGEDGCFGVQGDQNTSDTEPFVYIPWQNSSIFGPSEICQFVGITSYTASHPGTFSGPFITIDGQFDPWAAGVGQYFIDFLPSEPCVYASSFVINVVPQYTPFLDPAGPFCLDDSPFLLTSTMPGYFAGPGTDLSGLFNPTTAGVGTHLISFNAADQCGGSAILEIIVNPLPVVSAPIDAQICFGLPYPLAASGAATYVWSPSAFLNTTIGNLVTTSPTNAITYTVTGTDNNGCIGSDQVALTLLPLPTIQADPVAISCPGAGVTLSASGSAGDYQWEPATGLANPTALTTTATIFETASYSITVTDNCGLTASDDVDVSIEPELTVITGPDLAYCELTGIGVNAAVLGNFHTLLWTTPNGQLNPNEINQLNIYVETPGSYVLTATTQLGCSYSDGLTITETPLPVLALNSPLYLCPNGEVTMSAGNNWDEVAWENGIQTAQQTVYAPGIYDVTVTNDDCSSSGSVEVIAITLPYLELGPDQSICEDQSITFQIAEAGQWSGGSFSDAFTTNAAGTYGVTIVDGPCSITDSVSVTTRPLPFVDLPSEMVGCVDQGVVISASHPNNASYYWNNGDTTAYTIVYESGLYVVGVTNDCGTIQDEVMVSYEDCSYTLYLPNSFTPDNDGINDVWKIESYNIAKMNFMLFNRFGEKVLESTDPHFVWTGEFQDGSHYSPDGIYSYRLSYESTEGDVGTRKGIIFLLR